MKLFLASAFNQTAEKLVDCVGDVIGKKVIFIENASDVDDVEDKWWIRVDREAYERLGAEVITADLRLLSAGDFEKLLKQSDIIHFCGGSVFYLIDLIKKKGLKDSLVDAIKKDEIIYTGTSAGSMIVSGDLSVDKNDPEEIEIIKNINDFSGLGLLDFLIMPHADNADFSEGNKKVIDDVAKYKTALFYLCDNQAIFIKDKAINFIQK